MTGIVEYNDLCMTCNHGPTCVRRRHDGRPIWYCEEFDDYEPPPEKAAGTAAAPEPIPEPESVNSASVRLGLCVNCEFRNTCILQVSDGGVWHCEEYR